MITNGRIGVLSPVSTAPTELLLLSVSLFSDVAVESSWLSDEEFCTAVLSADALLFALVTPGAVVTDAVGVILTAEVDPVPEE